ncbi:MAG TPA: chemotaxis protein CheD, partial [Thermovirga lienii]|nr:chemotaxis protein CheD [Thermovirga lienii]
MNRVSIDKEVIQSSSMSISVGMGDIAVGKCPTILFSLGLGSCIGLVLYSPKDKIAAMA